jgi:3D (Asp-Asp-Asp) domain-containing protein
MSLARPDPPEVGPVIPVFIEDQPIQLAMLPLPELPYVGPEPLLASHAVRRRVKVTACSPEDSAADKEYYRTHGYEGATYNIAAHPSTFPLGTLIRVPGYMSVSYPGKFWEVDSKGGPVIRRARAAGVTQIDVKFKTRDAVMKWGVHWLTVEVITAGAQARWEAEHSAWAQRHAEFLRIEAICEQIDAENNRRARGNRSSLSPL